MMDCASILLAAGTSSRLGRPKQLLTIGSETLLRRTARLACEVGCFPNVVVLGAYAEQLRPQLADLPVEPIVHANWQQGMGSSLAAAMAYLQQQKILPKAVLLLVCDQPALDAEVLRTLITEVTSSGKPISACRYANVLGVPAVFTSAVFAELAALSGDQGARRLFARYQSDIAIVEFAAGSFDIDTDADARRLDGSA